MREPSRGAAWVAVLAAISACIAFAAWRHERRLGSELWAAAADHVQAEAVLGARLVAAWRDDRASDAAVLAAEPLLGAAANGAGRGAMAMPLLRVAARRHGYSEIALVRGDGSVALSLNGRSALDEAEVSLVERARREREVATAELQAGAPRGEPRMELAAPLPGGGAVVAVADPRARLLPQLSALAAARPGLAVEVVRWARAGPDVLLATQQKGELALSAAAPRGALALALAKHIPVEGLGPAGERVLAFGAPVEGSELTVVALVPEDEVLAAGGSARAALLLSLVSLGTLLAASVHLVRGRRGRRDAPGDELGERRSPSLDALVAGVAHRMNNPLASLVTNLDYAVSELTRPAAPPATEAAAPGAAERVRDDAEALAALRDASESAARLRAIVADLRDAGRPARQAEGPPARAASAGVRRGRP